jgi:hypothetical protein
MIGEDNERLSQYLIRMMPDSMISSMTAYSSLPANYNTAFGPINPMPRGANDMLLMQIKSPVKDGRRYFTGIEPRVTRSTAKR